MNLTPGGLFGYCSSKCITSLNVPSSKGVSEGPMMTAFLYFLSEIEQIDEAAGLRRMCKPLQPKWRTKS